MTGLFSMCQETHFRARLPCHILSFLGSEQNSLFLTSEILIIVSPTAKPPSWHFILKACQMNAGLLCLTPSLWPSYKCLLLPTLQTHRADIHTSAAHGLILIPPGPLWTTPHRKTSLIICSSLHELCWCFDYNISPHSVLGKASQIIHSLWTQCSIQRATELGF